MVSPEGLLDVAQAGPRTSDALDGGDLVASGLRGEHRTGLDRHAVQGHRAGPALGGVATDVGAG